MEGTIATEMAALHGKKILLPRAKIATAALPDGLREKGALVDEVPLYNTVEVAGEKSG